MAARLSIFFGSAAISDQNPCAVKVPKAWRHTFFIARPACTPTKVLLVNITRWRCLSMPSYTSLYMASEKALKTYNATTIAGVIAYDRALSGVVLMALYLLVSSLWTNYFNLFEITLGGILLTLLPGLYTMNSMHTSEFMYFSLHRKPD